MRGNTLFCAVLVWWYIAEKNGPEGPERTFLNNLFFDDSTVKNLVSTSSYCGFPIFTVAYINDHRYTGFYPR